MPTDLKPLVDLLLYLEKNFTTLPQEILRYGGGQGQTAFAGVRPVADYAPVSAQNSEVRAIMKRQRRSIRKRNRQRLSAHARRLRR